MKNILYWITHKTLDYEHADLSLRSIANQKTNGKKFDEFIIYNTHDWELSTKTIFEIYDKYDLNRFFDRVTVFPYDEETHKSLGGDIHTIVKHATSTYDEKDAVLIMKSDSLLSVNYFDTVLNDLHNTWQGDYTYFVAPWIQAKKRVSNEEIIEYTKREKFIKSDDITFFVEEAFGGLTDFDLRPDVSITDEQIKFTSCTVIRDFSCHYISVGLLPKIQINLQSWGGVNFSNLFNYFYADRLNQSFVVHKYHDIVSENRSNDREGPVKDWLNS
jgi:hypothetical protein